MESKFFKLFRKSGVPITLDVLSTVNHAGMTEPLFYKHLLSKGKHRNDFYRVRGELLEYGLIGYKLDENANKLIFLTKKGHEFVEGINEVEKMLQK